VKWDVSGDTNSYRVGQDGSYDLVCASPQAPQPPRVLPQCLAAVDDSVMLSPAYQECGDASEGPLTPGDVGKVVEDDGSSKPLLVAVEGRRWWYSREALVVVGQTRHSAVASPQVAAPCVVTPALVRQGVRVRRGPDWQWDDQDGHGTGVILERDHSGWASVAWEESGDKNSYRVGQEEAYDLVVASSYKELIAVLYPAEAPTAGPKITAADATPGTRVVRGSDWAWGVQDGAGRGTIQGPGDSDGWVKVKWDNNPGKSFPHRVGGDGCYDLAFAGIQPVTCRVHHVLVPFTKSPGEGSNVCDQCHNRIPNGDPMHRCAACDYDLCPGCYRRAAAGEEVGSPLSAAVARPGLRVCRGPAWNWDDQDGGGEGVVVGLDDDGWATVKWEKAGTNKYRVGQSGKFDLALAQRVFGDQVCLEALLQRVFDETKKLKSTMDRSGEVPNGFVVVRVDQVHNQPWKDSYMQQVTQVMRARGSELGSSPCSTVLTKSVAAQLVANANQDSLSTDAEAVLFHGTSPAAVPGIVSSRFDRDRCKFGLAGRGFYFAESITKSDEYTRTSNGLCCVVVCRVLLGRVKVCADMLLSRDQRQGLEDSVRKEGTYDSVMMDRERCRGTFREFVVYDTARCLPLFVVWYKRRTS